jgi:endonuclease-3
MTQGDAIKLLTKRYTAKGMVDFGTPEDTLIATLLSARARDEQVLKAYPGLRRAFPTLKALAEASPWAIEKQIATIGLYRAKAKALKALARLLIERHEGLVPRTMEDLIQLPGVGRKTASCVLGYAFKLPAIAVDTHVYRVAHRLGWAVGKTPEKVETELKNQVPKPLWREVNRVLIPFGREICKPGKPQCWHCPLVTICTYMPKTSPPKVVS